MLLSYERKLIEEEKFDTFFWSQCNNNNFNPKYFPVQSSTNQHGTVQWPDFIAKLIFVAIALKTVICEGSIIIDDNDTVEHQQQTAIFCTFSFLMRSLNYSYLGVASLIWIWILNQNLIAGKKLLDGGQIQTSQCSQRVRQAEEGDLNTLST